MVDPAVMAAANKAATATQLFRMISSHRNLLKTRQSSRSHSLALEQQ
jgi:hypothetical protein